MVCSGEECDKGRVQIRVFPEVMFENTSSRPPRPTRPEKPKEDKEEDVPIPVNGKVEEEPEPKPFRPFVDPAATSETGTERID